MNLPICKHAEIVCGYKHSLSGVPARCLTKCTLYEPKPHTNGDSARAMSDEEPADFLAKNRGGCRALTTESYVCNFYDDDLNTDCEKCWLDWLRQEADNAPGTLQG